MAPQVSTNKEIQQLYDALVKDACYRSADFSRLGGVNPSKAMKLTDEELAGLQVPRDVLPLLIEAHETPSSDEKRDEEEALEDALKTFRFPGPDIPNVPDDILSDIAQGKRTDWPNLTEETMHELEDLDDQDLHPVEILVGFGGYYDKSLNMSDLQHWSAKMGTLQWREPPTSRAELLAQVAYKTIDEWMRAGQVTTELNHFSKVILNNLTMGELEKAANDLNLKVDPKDDKVSLVARLMKCFYTEKLVEA